jgi:regulator of sirC expression with transglutaminase-like and TPR domain
VTHPFDELVMLRPEASWRLAEAALLFATDHDSESDPRECLRQLDDLASRVGALGAQTAGERVEALRHVLVEKHGLRGNRGDYFHPANSLLGQVLGTRRGLPITLSVIWLDVAGQLGWPLQPLGLPAHFMVAYREARTGEEIVVDPFDEGARMGRGDVPGHLADVVGSAPVLSESDFLPPTPRAILVRMVNNLNLVYLQRGEWPRAARTIRRLQALMPGDEALQRQADAVGERLLALN